MNIAVVMHSLTPSMHTVSVHDGGESAILEY